MLVRHQVHGSTLQSRRIDLSLDGSRAAVFAEFAPHRRPFSARSLGTWITLIRNGGRGDLPVDLIVVDLATGHRVGRLEDEARAVFSPDGRTFATAGYDGKARLRKLPAAAR
jgi:hypothetical protein